MTCWAAPEYEVGAAELPMLASCGNAEIILGLTDAEEGARSALCAALEGPPGLCTETDETRES